MTRVVDAPPLLTIIVLDLGQASAGRGDRSLPSVAWRPAAEVVMASDLAGRAEVTRAAEVLRVKSALAAQRAAQDAGLTGAPPQLLVERGIPRGPLVFTATDGGPLSASYVTHTLQRLLAAAGLPKLRTHDLRHLFVSNLFASGVPLELISPLVGHANPQVTRTIYLHLRADRKAEAAANLDHLWETGS